MTRKLLSPLERAIRAKRRTVKRLQEEIANEKRFAAARIARIEKRLSVARILAEALEKGLLEP